MTPLLDDPVLHRHQRRSNSGIPQLSECVIAPQGGATIPVDGSLGILICITRGIMILSPTRLDEEKPEHEVWWAGGHDSRVIVAVHIIHGLPIGKKGVRGARIVARDAEQGLV